MRKKRLCYLARLNKANFSALIAVLQAGSPLGKKQPWVDFVLSDIAVLRVALPNVFAGVPEVDVDPVPLWNLVCHYPVEWKKSVASYFSTSDDS